MDRVTLLMERIRRRLVEMVREAGRESVALQTEMGKLGGGSGRLIAGRIGLVRRSNQAIEKAPLVGATGGALR